MVRRCIFKVEKCLRVCDCGYVIPPPTILDNTGLNKLLDMPLVRDLKLVVEYIMNLYIAGAKFIKEKTTHQSNPTSFDRLCIWKL